MVTTVIEIAGALLLIAGAAVWVAGFSVPAALAVAGVGLIGLSFLVSVLGGRK